MIYQKYKKSLYDFIPQDFGAKGDCVRVEGVSMSAGSTSVTKAGGGFTPDMDGKIAKIDFAGASGNDLVATVTYVSSTQITLSSAAAGGTTSHVKNIYIGTDDTAAVQACINACVESGVRLGRVLLQGIYVINGGIVTSYDSGTYNSQLIIPFVNYMSGLLGGITIDGMLPGCYTDNNPRASDPILPSMNFNGFVSFLTTDTERAAVIGTGRKGGVNFNVHNICLKNLKILVPTNGMGQGAGCCGVNFEWAGNYQIEDVVINIDNSFPYSVEPTNGAIGFIGNNLDSDAMNTINRLSIGGFYIGAELAPEHVNVGLIDLLACGTGLMVKAARFLLQIDMMLLHWCKNQIEYRRYTKPDSSIQEGAKINVDALEVEALGVENHPVTTNPSWLGTPNSIGLVIDLQHELTGQMIGGVQSGSVSVGIGSSSQHSGFRIITPAQLAAT